MINTVFDFIKNHISIIISVISICLSIYNFSYSIFTRCKKIQFQIIKYKRLIINGYKIFQFQFIITNKSQLPISISNISLNSIYCKFDPTRITDKVSTIPFPIVLNSLEAKSGWLEFKTQDEIDINSMSFNLYTSRGSIQDITPKIENIINDTPCRLNNCKL